VSALGRHAVSAARQVPAPAHSPGVSARRQERERRASLLLYGVGRSIHDARKMPRNPKEVKSLGHAIAGSLTASGEWVNL
jgi:hypothetical protein